MQTEKKLPADEILWTITTSDAKSHQFEQTRDKVVQHPDRIEATTNYEYDAQSAGYHQKWTKQITIFKTQIVKIEVMTTTHSPLPEDDGNL